MTDKKVYMLGICGIGMGSLAGYLSESGLSVSGSDQNIYPPMSDLLSSLKVKVRKGYDGSNVKEADCYIVGNAISKDNPEVRELESKNKHFYSMPGYMEKFLLKNKHSLVVAGTHGKTTTTALLGWTMAWMGFDPSVFCGGIIKKWNKSYRRGKGDYFVLEGDEYDSAFFDKVPKFLHYLPKDIILTSIEFDHADIYESLEQIKEQFAKLIDMIPSDGNILAFGADENLKEVLRKKNRKAITYGMGENDLYRAEIVSASPDGFEFKVFKEGKEFILIKLPMLGKQNVVNALGVIGLLDRLSVPKARIKEGLETFPGVKRRGDILGKFGGITVVEDFAHHPTAIELTLEAFSMAYPQGRIWAVFEPRTNTSRRKFFEQRLENAFKDADKVVIAGVFNADQLGDEALDAKGLADSMQKKGKDAYYVPEVKDIVSKLVSEAKRGDMIIIMSNGGFDNIYEKLTDALAKN